MSSFWPRSLKIQDIGLNTLGSLIAGFTGSIILIIIVFASAKVLSIPQSFETARLSNETSNIFPFILALITFFVTSCSFLLATKLLQLTDSEKFQPNRLLISHMLFFWLVVYICFTPIYLISAQKNYDNLILIFIVHSLFLAFGTSLLQEIFSNYRYILVGFYGSSLALFFTSTLTLLIFLSFDGWYARLVSLLIILPLIITSMTFFKGIFEYFYTKYYYFTNLDPLGDIQKQLEKQSEEELKELEQKNML